MGVTWRALQRDTRSRCAWGLLIGWGLRPCVGHLTPILLPLAREWEGSGDTRGAAYPGRSTPVHPSSQSSGIVDRCWARQSLRQQTAHSSRPCCRLVCTRTPTPRECQQIRGASYARVGDLLREWGRSRRAHNDFCPTPRPRGARARAGLVWSPRRAASPLGWFLLCLSGGITSGRSSQGGGGLVVWWWWWEPKAWDGAASSMGERWSLWWA
jgi:hypothetical protein